MFPGDDSERNVSLKEYIERIFDEREKALQLAFKSQQDALSLATTSLNRELEHLNKLREEINTNRREYVTRSEWSTVHKTLEDSVGRLEHLIDTAEGSRRGLSMAWQVILGGVAALGTIALIWEAFHK